MTLEKRSAVVVVYRVVLGLLATVAAERISVGAELLTNTDVVTMIKADIPESTIIMAIRQGPAGFDTSPRALIELKQQGATAGILEAMMQPTVSPAPAKASTGSASLDARNEVPSAKPEAGAVDEGILPAKASTGNALLDAYNEELAAKAKGSAAAETHENVSTGVVLRDGSNAVEMKYITMGYESPPNFGRFAPDRVYRTIAGKSSSCRVSSGNLSFEFSLPRNVQPAPRVALVRFAERGQNRVVQCSSSGPFGAGGSRGYPKERVVAVEITESKTQAETTRNWFTRYVAVPTSPMVPGEYAFILEDLAYDFGVDGSRETTR